MSEPSYHPKGNLLRFLSCISPIEVSFETNLPQSGLVISNHTSHVDALILGAVLRSMGCDPVFMAAAGLWKIPILRTILDQGNHIPVYRNSSRAVDALKVAGEVLRSDGMIVMYPEGGIPSWDGSQDRAPAEFKTGAARLGSETGVPIIPVGHVGARRVMSGNAYRQVAGAVTACLRRPVQHLHFGAPLYITTGEDLRRNTDTLRRAVTKAWQVSVNRLNEQ